MRKYLSILLCAALALALFAPGAFAVDEVTDAAGSGARSISSANDFDRMNPDGDYILTTDITLKYTYSDKFTGTLDGNGHTVTTTVPLFADMSGTVRNLRIEGEIIAISPAGVLSNATSGHAVIDRVISSVNVSGNGTSAPCGWIATASAKSEITLSSCINNGNVTGTGQTGAFIGFSEGGKLTMTNCTNNGRIKSSSNNASGLCAQFGKDESTLADVCKITNCTNNGAILGAVGPCGGILAYSSGLITIENCLNRGSVTATTGSSAGIYGKPSTTVNALLINYCFNYGEITTRNGYAGGICGHGGSAAPPDGYNYAIKNCGNFGQIVLYADIASTNYVVGGIVGYMYGTSSIGNVVDGCFNVGNVICHSEVAPDSSHFRTAAGICGYYNATKFYITNNVNAGTVSATGDGVLVNQIFYNKNEGGSPIKSPVYAGGNQAITVPGAVYETNGKLSPSYTLITSYQPPEIIDAGATIFSFRNTTGSGTEDEEPLNEGEQTQPVESAGCGASTAGSFAVLAACLGAGIAVRKRRK